MASVAALLLTTILCIIWPSCSEECLNAYECVGRSFINDTDHTAFNGYKSGFGPTTSWHGGSVNCRAAFSCNAMSFLTGISGPDLYIMGDGVFACANTTITTTYDGLCSGANSCAFSQLSVVSHYIDCGGHQSCAFADIKNTPQVDGAGAYSLYKATIDTQDLGNPRDFTIELYADYAAYGATLTCGSGYTCNVNCYAYNACFMFYLNCIGTCYVNTRFDGMDTIAPITDITQFDSNPPIPSLQDSMTLSTSNEELCNTQPTAVTSDNRRERMDIDIVMDTAGPICCRGRDSCRQNVIQYQGITGQSVMCSGHNACRYSDIDTNNGMIFCGARKGCFESIIRNSDIVYCTGWDSCLSANITNSSTILCSGSWSCERANIVSNGTDLSVNFTAYRSAKYANIYCNAGDVCNIVCSGYESCLDATLYCDGICEVQCDTLSLCPFIITLDPTKATIDPTSKPTEHPSLDPTQNPSSNPTLYPSFHPTQYPSLIPTEATQPPSNPTHNPSSIPTQVTEGPSNPTRDPTSTPLQQPSLNPTQQPLIGTVFTIQTSMDTDDAITTQFNSNTFNDLDVRADSSPFLVFIILGIAGCVIGIVLMFVFCYYCDNYKKKSIVEREIVASQSTNQHDEQDMKGEPLGHADGVIASKPMNHAGNQNKEGENMDEITVEGEDMKRNKTNGTIGNDSENEDAGNIAPDEFVVCGDDDRSTKF